MDDLVTALCGAVGVVAVWIDGSLARDDGDEHSDVDLGVVVDGGSLDEFIEALPELVRGACAAVLVQSRGPLLNLVTSDWLRADIFVRTREEAAAGVGGPITVVHDPDGLVTVTSEGEPPSTAARLLPLIEEFLRFLGLLPIVAARDEWIGAFVATGPMTGMLIDLMQLENGTLRTIGGALRVTERLNREQRTELASLPPLGTNMASVASVHVALARRFVPRARRLAAAHGVAYPDALEDAVVSHLGRYGFEPLLGR